MKCKNLTLKTVLEQTQQEQPPSAQKPAGENLPKDIEVELTDLLRRIETEAKDKLFDTALNTLLRIAEAEIQKTKTSIGDDQFRGNIEPIRLRAFLAAKHILSDIANSFSEKKDNLEIFKKAGKKK